MTDADLPEKSAEDVERARRRRLLIVTLILLFGLPVYLIVAASLVAALNPPEASQEGGRQLHWLLELAVYVGLGLVWAWPLKRLVRGLGKRRS